MKILVVSHAAATFGESKGGADVLALRHAVFLSHGFGDVEYVGTLASTDSGTLTHVAVRDSDLLAYDRLGSRGAEVGYLLNHFVRAVKAALVANREFRRYRPDLVITHTSLATIILKVLHRRTPLVYQIHDGLFVHRTVRTLGKRLVRFLMNDLLELAAVRRADHILCVSSSIYAQLVEAGVPPEKLSVVPYLPPRVEVQEARRGTEATSSFALSVSPFILSVGQQTGRKRFDLLIEAMQFTTSPLHLVIVGDGPLQGPYTVLRDRLGLGARVHLQRSVSDVELAGLYSHATAFFLVSTNEGLPITVSEAESYGCRSVFFCPNIQTTTDYRKDLAQVVDRIPTAREIAQFMDDACGGSPGEKAEADLRRAEAASGAGADQAYGAMQSLYRSVFRRVLNLRSDVEGASRAS